MPEEYTESKTPEAIGEFDPFLGTASYVLDLVCDGVERNLANPNNVDKFFDIEDFEMVGLIFVPHSGVSIIHPVVATPYGQPFNSYALIGDCFSGAVPVEYEDRVDAINIAVDWQIPNGPGKVKYSPITRFTEWDKNGHWFFTDHGPVNNPDTAVGLKRNLETFVDCNNHKDAISLLKFIRSGIARAAGIN